MDDPGHQGQKFAKQEPDKFTKAEVQKLAKHVPDVELSLMELDFPTKLWQNPAIHLQMQTKLKSAVVAIAHKHPLIGPRFLLLQAQVKDPGDLYQGSRAVANMYAAMAQYLEVHKLQLNMACSQIILTLRDTEPLTVGDFVTAVRDVERYIVLFELAEIKGSDESFTADLIAAVKYNQNHLVVKAMTSPNEPKTIAELVKRLADLPMQSGSATGFSASVFTAVSRAVQSVASLATGSSIAPVVPTSCPDGFVPKRKFEDMVRARDRIRQTALDHGVPAEALRKKPDPPTGRGRGRGTWPRRQGPARPDISLASADASRVEQYENQVVANFAGDPDGETHMDHDSETTLPVDKPEPYPDADAPGWNAADSTELIPDDSSKSPTPPLTADSPRSARPTSTSPTPPETADLPRRSPPTSPPRSPRPSTSKTGTPTGSSRIRPGRKISGSPWHHRLRNRGSRSGYNYL